MSAVDTAWLLPVPEVAAGATEVVLSEWLVAPGEQVAAGDAIAVIETEKAVVEIEAERDGTVLATLVLPGATVEVGSPMALLGSPEQLGDVDALLAELGHTAMQPAPAASDPVLSAPEPEPVVASPARRLFVSPIARKRLAEAGISAEEVVGSGPGGRIRRRDVEATLAERSDRAAEPASAAAAPPHGGVRDVPHSRLRLAVARRLTASKNEIPHFYVRRTAVVDELLALRAQLNEVVPDRISVNDLLVKAIAVAHARVPGVNVVWTEKALRHFDRVDVAVAVASDRGLVTPVLRGVDQMSVTAIAARVRELAAAADAGELRQDDLEGGATTISNLGMYGVDEFAAIINPPHSSILAVGAARSLAHVRGEQVVAVRAMDLVLSVDHRAIDGALAAQWMAALVEAVEHPLRLLI